MKAKKRNPDKLKLLYIIFIFFGMELLYQLLRILEQMYFPSTPFVILFPILALGALIIIYMIQTRGFRQKPFTEEDMDPTLSRDRRQALADEYNEKREKAKKLIFFIVPLSLVLSFDLLNLYIIEPFAQSLSKS